jgi:hypothetical protein
MIIYKNIGLDNIRKKKKRKEWRKIYLIEVIKKVLISLILFNINRRLRDTRKLNYMKL